MPGKAKAGFCFKCGAPMLDSINGDIRETTSRKQRHYLALQIFGGTAIQEEGPVVQRL